MASGLGRWSGLGTGRGATGRAMPDTRMPDTRLPGIGLVGGARLVDVDEGGEREEPHQRLIGGMVFGPLDDLVRERGVTDIAVTPDGRVWADRGHGMEERTLTVGFPSPAAVRSFAMQLCSQMGRRLDDSCPICDAGTYDGVRLHAVMEPIVPQGAAISIRLPDASDLDLGALASRGMFPPQWHALLRALVRGRASILISGGTGSGKTTLLKALLAHCPQAERIVTVEETRELGALHHLDCVSLVTRQANVEGKGGIGLAALVKATVRMRPDRIVLGECRGEEVADLVRALNSGHRGGMATIHADSVERLPARLSALGMLAGMTPTALSMMCEGAFDVVVHVERDHTGVRRITQIGCLATGAQGWLEGRVLARWNGAGPPRCEEAWQAWASQWMPGDGSG